MSNIKSKNTSILFGSNLIAMKRKNFNEFPQYLHPAYLFPPGLFALSSGSLSSGHVGNSSTRIRFDDDQIIIIIFIIQSKQAYSLTQCYINIVSAMGVIQTVRTPPPLPSWVSINSGPSVKHRTHQAWYQVPYKSVSVLIHGTNWLCQMDFPSVLMRNHVIYGTHWGIF